jgi:hypothetical protein
MTVREGKIGAAGQNNHWDLECDLRSITCRHSNRTPVFIYSGRKDLFFRSLQFNRQAAREKLNSVVRVVQTGLRHNLQEFRDLLQPSEFDNKFAALRKGMLNSSCLRVATL